MADIDALRQAMEEANRNVLAAAQRQNVQQQQVQAAEQQLQAAEQARREFPSELGNTRQLVEEAGRNANAAEAELDAASTEEAKARNELLRLDGILVAAISAAGVANAAAVAAEIASDAMLKLNPVLDAAAVAAWIADATAAAAVTAAAADKAAQLLRLGQTENALRQARAKAGEAGSKLQALRTVLDNMKIQNVDAAVEEARQNLATRRAALAAADAELRRARDVAAQANSDFNEAVFVIDSDVSDISESELRP